MPAPISRSSEYGIRALTYLATQSGEEYHLARDMSERLGIPAHFLVKVLQPLVVRGLIQSQRGRTGGFRLARPPDGISLFEIVDAHEHITRTRRCFLGEAECEDDRGCPLHEYWTVAYDSFLDRLRSTSIQDLARYSEIRPECGYPLFEAP